MSESSPFDETHWQVPPWLHIPRLEALIGCKCSEISWATLERLIREKRPEDLTLEYKESTYARDAKGPHDLAVDVAALANAAGGVILLGVRQDTHGRALGFRPAKLDDDERRRIRQILGTRIAPLVPDVTIGLIKDPTSDGTKGVYAILVPASQQGPHGVITQSSDAYAWPVRDESRIRYMREPELAERYRHRGELKDGAQARLRRVVTAGVNKLDRSEQIWLAIGMTPTQAGLSVIDRSQAEAWLTNRRHDFPGTGSIDSHTNLVGRERAIFTDHFPFTGVSQDRHVELHHDGSSFAAVHITEMGEVDGTQTPNGEAFPVAYEDLETWCLGLIGLQASYAVDMGGNGDLLTDVTLMSANEPDPFPTFDRPIPTVVSEFYGALGGAKPLGQSVIAGSRPLAHLESVSRALPASVTSSPQDLVSAVAAIVTIIASDFGAVPSEPALLADGSVVRGTFNKPRLEGLLDWADRAGLLRSARV